MVSLILRFEIVELVVVRISNRGESTIFDK